MLKLYMADKLPEMKCTCIFFHLHDVDSFRKRSDSTQYKDTYTTN